MTMEDKVGMSGFKRPSKYRHKIVSKRGSIDVPTWIGQERFLGIYNDDRYAFDKHNENRKAMCFLFETGGRVSEVISLRPEQFEWNEYSVVVYGMPVLKYRKRKGQRKRMTRDVYIPRDDKEPLAEELIQFVQDCKTDFIFPKRSPFLSDPIPHEHTSRSRMYYLCSDLNYNNSNLFPHWFRSMRASFLVYVRGFNVFELKEWFLWKSMDTPGEYVRGVELAKKLGIKELPSGMNISIPGEIEKSLELKESPTVKAQKPQEESEFDRVSPTRVVEKPQELDRSAPSRKKTPYERLKEIMES